MLAAVVRLGRTLDWFVEEATLSTSSESIMLVARARLKDSCSLVTMLHARSSLRLPLGTGLSSSFRTMLRPLDLSKRWAGIVSATVGVYSEAQPVSKAESASSEALALAARDELGEHS